MAPPLLGLAPPSVREILNPPLGWSDDCFKFEVDIIFSIVQKVRPLPFFVSLLASIRLSNSQFSQGDRSDYSQSPCRSVTFYTLLKIFIFRGMLVPSITYAILNWIPEFIPGDLQLSFENLLFRISELKTWNF